MHGLTNVAGDYHEAFAEFMNRGYTAEEIYATTYGPYGTPVNYSCTLDCGYVKQARAFEKKFGDGMELIRNGA